MAETIVVAAAVVERDGRFLLTRRLKGTHLAGTWEFPGGKCHPGETVVACLSREMREELAVQIAVDGLLLLTAHDYGDRVVEIHFFRCTLMEEPVPQLGQDMRWARREELKALEFPPADEALIELLAAEKHRSSPPNGA
jgi:8-oxo-dGTP diphosphatase